MSTGDQTCGIKLDRKEFIRKKLNKTVFQSVVLSFRNKSFRAESKLLYFLKFSGKNTLKIPKESKRLVVEIHNK